MVKATRTTARNTTSQASARRLAAILGVAAATLVGPLAWPAQADNNHDRRNEPRQRQVHRQEPRRGASYDHRPDVYYSAPPVVYEPPAYQQPGPGLSLTIPFFYR